MSDNTLLNAGSGGDSVRDVERTIGSGIKTQVVQLDFGGASGNAEQLATSSNPLPVADSDADGFRETTQYEWQLALLIEHRLMNRILFEGLGLKGDIDQWRQDELQTYAQNDNAT